MQRAMRVHTYSFNRLSNFYIIFRNYMKQLVYIIILTIISLILIMILSEN